MGAKRRKKILALDELDKHGSVDHEGFGFFCEASGGGIVGEDGDGGGALIGAEEPAAGWIEGDVPSEAAARVDSLLLGEQAGGRVDAEDDE